MKTTLVVLAATMAMASMPAMAADQHGNKGHDAACLKECLMQARNCGQEVDSLQQRISKLNRELQKGTAVYTADELRVLEQKLKDTEATLATISIGI